MCYGMVSRRHVDTMQLLRGAIGEHKKKKVAPKGMLVQRFDALTSCLSLTLGLAKVSLDSVCKAQEERCDVLIG